MRAIIILLLLVTLGLEAQEFKSEVRLPLSVDTFIGFDTYQNLYTIKDNILSMKGANGNFSFNDVLLGSIRSVDIINPLKLVVFYQDTNTVLFLDNRLNEIERINFNQLPEIITLVSATNAGGNRLWVFNGDTLQMELYNYRDKRKTTVSQPFVGELISQQSDFNYCAALSQKKLRVFNTYGSLISEIEASDFEKITYANKNIIGLKENNLFYLQNAKSEGVSNSFEPIKLPISENNIKDLQLTKEFLYIYDGKALHTFSIKQSK